MESFENPKINLTKKEKKNKLTEEESQNRKRESRRKYLASEKGKIAVRKYQKSDKGKVATKKAFNNFCIKMAKKLENKNENTEN